MSFQAKNSDNSALYETPTPVTYNTSGYFRAEAMAPLQSTASNNKDKGKGKGEKIRLVPSYGGSPFSSGSVQDTGPYGSVASSY